MKKTTLLSILLSIACLAQAQLKSEVNECFELTSIVFRLAEAKEYVNNVLEDYTNDIDRYFAKHKEHKLIPYIKEIRGKHGIGYDAIPKLTGSLIIKNGKVSINPEIKVEDICEIDKRWTKETVSTFVHLLNDFYRKSKFRTFYNRHTELYRLAEERLNEQLKVVNIDWFNTLFGEEQQKPLVIASVSNGPHNYAFTIPEKMPRTGIIVGSGVDNKGLPIFRAGFISIIIHEIGHHFTNQRIHNYWEQMEPAATTIYSYIKEKMANNAYGNAKTTMNEWFTNLIVLMYLQDNPIQQLYVPSLTSNYQNRGFIWMRRALTFMEHFRNNRKTFATIDDFMPQIVGFLNFTANNMEQVIHEYTYRQPYITDIYPASGTTITADMDTIKICFSERMMTGASSMMNVDEEHVSMPPILKDPYWQDEYTFVIVLNKDKLSKEKKYGFKLKRSFFISKLDNSPMKEDFYYTFTIADE